MRARIFAAQLPVVKVQGPLQRLGIAPLGDVRDFLTHIGDRRMAEHRFRRANRHTLPEQQLARKIESSARGILLEIAQDVGELQRAAQRMGDTVGVR